MVQDFLDANPIQVVPECHDTTSPCMFALWYYWPECILSKEIKECVRRERKC
jgi:hypothetical protein